MSTTEKILKFQPENNPFSERERKKIELITFQKQASPFYVTFVGSLPPEKWVLLKIRFSVKLFFPRWKISSSGGIFFPPWGRKVSLSLFSAFFHFTNDTKAKTKTHLILLPRPYPIKQILEWFLAVVQFKNSDTLSNNKFSSSGCCIA